MSEILARGLGARNGLLGAGRHAASVIPAGVRTPAARLGTHCPGGTPPLLGDPHRARANRREPLRVDMTPVPLRAAPIPTDAPCSNHGGFASNPLGRSEAMPGLIRSLGRLLV